MNKRLGDGEALDSLLQSHSHRENRPSLQNQRRHSTPGEDLPGSLCVWLLKQLNSGKVIAVGPGSRDKAGNLIPVSVKEGDHVLLPEYGGTQIKLDDKEYGFEIVFHLFRDEDILGILHD
ncbi:chaperonin [Glycine soja]